MARLVEHPSGTLHPLPAEAQIGRSSACEVRLQNSSVSSRHALLRWRDDRWEIRDLGSRNGTWVDERRLDPGEVATITSTTALRVADVVLQLEGGPPEAWAEAPDGQRVYAENGILSLPNDTAQVYRDPAVGWVVDQGGDVLPAPPSLTLDDVHWRLVLPDPPTATATMEAPVLGGLRLAFQVSADEEWVGLSVLTRGREIVLQPRAHLYLLLTLARQRLEDAALEEAAQGWISQERLARQLRIPSGHVSLQVFRARRQLAEAGVVDAAGVVERRSRTGQLRLGTAAITVEALSG